MKLGIDFNDPLAVRLLLGKVRVRPKNKTFIEVRPGVFADDNRGSIILGDAGGLAYSLFGRYESIADYCRISDRRSLRKFQSYLESVKTYLDLAENIASKSDFSLVSIVISRPRTEILDFKDDSPLCSAGIGSKEIRDAKRFEAFLNMLKGGKRELENSYGKFKLLKYS